jgi:hypothetical protein
MSKVQTARTMTRVFIAAALLAAGENYSCPAPSAQDNFDPFDFYGKISWEDEKARLDNFAAALQENPDVVGYIIVYASLRSCVGEARAHARRAKDYLVKTRHIRQNQLRAIAGGYEQEFKVILQPVPVGAGDFTPAPMLRPSDAIVTNCKPKSLKRRKRGS